MKGKKVIRVKEGWLRRDSFIGSGRGKIAIGGNYIWRRKCECFPKPFKVRITIEEIKE